MPPLRDAFLVDAVRTPIARFKGGLATVRPDDLAAHVLAAARPAQRPPSPRSVDHVVFGATNQAGEDNRNVARMAALVAGLPVRGARRDGEPPLRLGPRGGVRRREAHRGRATPTSSSPAASRA